MRSKQQLEQEYEDLLWAMALTDDLEQETDELIAEIAEKEARGETAEEDRFFQRTARKTRKVIEWEIRKKDLRHFATHTLPRVAQMAAAVLLIFYVGLTTAVATVSSVRAKVLELLMRPEDQFTELRLVEKEDAAFDVPVDWKGSFYPAYIPEGFDVSSIEALGAENHVQCENSAGAFFGFSEAGTSTLTRIDTENAEVSAILINGNSAILSVKGQQVVIAWAFQDRYFVIQSSVDIDVVIRIAESITRII